MHQLSPRPRNSVVALRNELAVLKAVRDFGHLRRAEIARAVWPATESQKMAQRTVQRLLKQKDLVERLNVFQEACFVLSERGAERLLGEEIPAYHGYSLTSMEGAQYKHRLLATRYLIERRVGGGEILSEYGLARRLGVVDRADLIGCYKKCPDGLVFVPGAERHYEPTYQAVDWIEVESAVKPLSELERICELAWGIRALVKNPRVVIDRIVFVFEKRRAHRHEHAIAEAVRRYAKSHPFEDAETRDRIVASFMLVRCNVTPVFEWNGYEEVPLRPLLTEDDLPLQSPSISEPAQSV